MPGAAVEMSLEQFAAACDSTGRDRLLTDFTKPLKVCKQLAIADMKDNFVGSHDPDGNPWLPLRRARPNSKGTDQALRNTGILAASVTGNGAGHIEQLTPTTLVLGTNLDRAAIHQHGGTLVPTKAKALTIPLTKEAARAGSPRDFKGDLFVVSTQAHGFLAQRRGKGKRSKLTLHYLFMDRVEIPARPFVGIGVKLAGKFEDVVVEHVGRGLLDLGGAV